MASIVEHFAVFLFVLHFTEIFPKQFENTDDTNEIPIIKKKKKNRFWLTYKLNRNNTYVCKDKKQRWSNLF